MKENSAVKLYRRRFIPDETVHLKDDIICYRDDDIIITDWKVLKPRKDFVRGRSCFFLKRGFKISRFIDSDDRILYTYCDIVRTTYDAVDNSFLFEDLLVDVIVYENGFVKVLDLAEISEALERELITREMAGEALVLTDQLLSIIYDGKFGELTSYLDGGRDGREFA